MRVLEGRMTHANIDYSLTFTLGKLKTYLWLLLCVHYSLLEAKDNNFGVVIWPLTHSQV